MRSDNEMTVEEAIRVLSNLRLPQRLTFVCKDEIEAVEFAIEELKRIEKSRRTFDNNINIKL